MTLGDILTDCVDQAQQRDIPITILTVAPMFAKQARSLGLDASPRTEIPTWAEDQLRAAWRDRLARYSARTPQ
ncbi:hypothetical protein [Rhodococcus rhodochrous]|uniref:hypothetical protein n=1 Tax=Rhodococcus rhodochrous TaxID=1829 RepID=UPI001782C2B4|nr:hypothetical protein [Rhodococcus rhodochrous]QOH59905.1 hypothetical protein C6Y44_27845 [Rhodococcus rhodochrous]